ncbi:hypothetical protein Tco_0609016 [Tanacetum coccineum]
MELLQGATPICEGSCRLTFLERQEVCNDCRSCKVRISSNGNLLWEASVLLGGVRVSHEDDRGVTEGREGVREVFQQRRSGAKRKLSRCGRNQLGNEPILALPEGADDFVVYYDARSKDLEACLEKGRSEFDFEAKYHLGKANVDVVPWNKTSKAKNASTWDVAWLGPTSVKRYGEWFILVRQGSDLHLERCKDLGYRIGIVCEILSENDAIDQLEWNLWHAPWLSDQLEWNLWHAPWLSDQLEWNLCMSPPIRRKYRASVAFATGCRRINKIRRGNRKIRVPIAMWPCKVEEKMTLKEVDGKTIQEFETKIIAKDGTITRVPGTFQGYETSEEESVERPRKRDLYEFVNHPQLQQRSHRNEFAPRRLSQSSGNMNGWLVEDEDEVERNEVDSDLESTASSKPVWEKTTKADRDRASYHCPWCSK